MVSWTSAGLYPASIIRATAARQAAVSFAFPSVSACITACNAPAQALSSFATRGRVGCLLSPAEHRSSRTSIWFGLRGSSEAASASVYRCSRSRCSSSTPRGPELLPAFDQAGHGLPARRHFAVRVAPARPPGELRVGDAPRPRLRVARRVGHVLHAADHAALENGDAIGAGRAVRKGPPPGDAWVGHSLPELRR